MKNKHILTLTLLSGLSLALSCGREPAPGTLPKNGEPAVNFISVPMAEVKSAQMGGESIYNENTIRRLDVFLYPMGGTGSDAVLHRRFDVTAGDGSDGMVQEHIYLNAGPLAELAGASRRCEIYTLANLPDNYSFEDSDPAGTDLGSLQNLAVQGNFASRLPSLYPEDDITFVMDSRDTLQFVSSSSNLVATGTYHDGGTGAVKLRRVAAKMHIHVILEPELTVSDVSVVGGDTITSYDKWIPVTEPLEQNLLVYLNNANDNGKAGGEPLTVSDDSELFRYPARTTVDRGPVSIPVDSLTLTFDHSYYAEPFYTYPMKWEYGSKNEPYVKIEQSWGHVLKGAAGNYVTDSEGNYVIDKVKKFYYKVFFPMKEFKRNTWYETGIHLGLLGSETDETALELDDCYYYVVPWSNGYSGNSGIAEIEGRVGSARYLKVRYSFDDAGNINLYNLENVSIPYISSHDCELEVLSAYAVDYSGDFPSNDAFDGSEYFSLSGGNIVFNHPLNNNIEDDDLDVGTYHFSIEIRHRDNPSFMQRIDIIQYPAMYISYAISNGYVFVNDVAHVDSDNTIGPNGNIDWPYENWYGEIIDNTSTYVTSDYYDYSLGTINDPDYAINTEAYTTNTNPNLYTIHVSVLDNTDMYIADTRDEPTSMNAFEYGKLDAYQKTRHDAGMGVSPQFKIASSYGKTVALSFEEAEMRCAAYQEGGYPQGRWRLPSPGEIKFAVSLSKLGKIPSLFDGQYWCSDGTFYSTEYLEDGASNYQYEITEGFNTPRAGTDPDLWVRCVYDTWYWGINPVSGYEETAVWSQNL